MSATTIPLGLELHLATPHRRGALARSPYTGAAGGAACGDVIRISLRLAGGRVAEAGFDATGCVAARGAGSAAAALAEDAHIFDAAGIDADAIGRELGGLAPAHRHGLELAADALHRALGAAARDGDIQLPAAPRRTLVAMSGGVDSAAAAQLALDRGDEVLAVTLELWADAATDGERSCCSPQAVTGARALAHRMGLPHLTLDLRERFRSEVVDDFLAGYRAGTTPNPCLRCNGLVRFDALLELASRLGAARLVTGHYARIVRDREGPLVGAAVDTNKDQSYVLARLGADALERLDFPLGEFEKPRVRQLARAAGLPVADKPESQDLCFLAGTGARNFMRRHGNGLPGDGEIVDGAGRVLGRHDGHHNFTVGQRRGLGIGAPEPLYVLAKDARRNRIVVGPKAALATRSASIGPAHLHRPASAVDAVKLRYRAAAVPCTVAGDHGPGAHGRLELELDHDVAGGAPGQTACLLSGDRVVGWGTIA